MADLKTILRELSVILGISLCKNRLNINSFIPKKFIELIKEFCLNILDYPLELEKLDKSDFTKEEISIIINGIELGKYIYSKLKLDGDIIWLGPQNISDYPSDISIGDTEISLKEASYILKNPSFGEYLNALTSPGVPFKTVHVFRRFAKPEFENWFDYTFSKLRTIPSNTDGTIYCYYKSKNLYCIKRIGNQLIFSKDVIENKISDDEFINEEKFDKIIPSDIIEHSFSKWIKENLEKSDEQYLSLKKYCSETAGKNLISYIINNQNIDERKFLEILQIYDKNYYYAKNDGRRIELFKVPNKSQTSLKIKNMSFLVPKSQLNILFTFEISIKIKNGRRTEEIDMHVECRYSHGQFKGVPEAKLYCKDNLSKLYELI